MTPQELKALLDEHGSRKENEASRPEGTAREQSRADLLLGGGVLSRCRELWSTQSDELDSLAEILANGSRDETWRLPYGDSGILDFFLGLLAESSLRQKLHVHALRLIGNCCADTNENRARVVRDDRLALITRHLDNEDLMPFNVPVIYNILVDYELAQALASRSRVSTQLVHLLSKPCEADHAPLVSYICKILALLVSQDDEVAAADPGTVTILLERANRPDVRSDLATFTAISGVAVAYLASEVFQARLISDNQVPLLLDAFYLAHCWFDDTETLDGDEEEGEDSLAAQLKRLRTSLLSALADVSGNDAFATAYALSDTVPQTFLAWVRTGSNGLRSAACLALGNISRSDETSRALIDIYHVQVPLLHVLTDPSVTDSQLLHAACSFLKNLAIPAANKCKLQDLLRPGAIPRLYALDTSPQVQFAAVSLTRQLLLNCPTNVTEFCAVVSTAEDGHGTARDTPVDNPQAAGRTGAADIVALFGRSDAEPTKLEAARCIAAICKFPHCSPPSSTSSTSTSLLTALPTPVTDDDARATAIAFYTTHPVHEPLRFLITQKKWPSLRSEAWFVFALMARSTTGARAVSVILDNSLAQDALTEAVTAGRSRPEHETQHHGHRHDDDTSEPLDAELATAAASQLQLAPQQPDPSPGETRTAMAGADAENTLCLCAELVKMADGGEIKLPERLAVLLPRLVRDGLKIVAEHGASRQR
ncbi:Armadillo-type fold protein [Moelleriella libera RCEF 2490]|uniref:Armadillo-type fold protein n=1 Tax=Moelleriella libera RCEF 2490 TaxID=1081109 RepID=A0A168F353_9HYPO|nr:Armadillo-type fold protein [Moelleriella libera RCEF 2490]